VFKSLLYDDYECYTGGGFIGAGGDVGQHDGLAVMEFSTVAFFVLKNKSQEFLD